MRLASRFAANPVGFAVLLAVCTGLLLACVGLGPNALPYPPAQQTPPTSENLRLVPQGWPFSDAVITHWPNALFLQRSIRTGAFPLWRPLIMSGQPFATNPLNKVWYPPQWLVVVLPVTLHLNLLIWAHLVLAGLGMRALGCRLGLGTSTASIIGVAYAFTPRIAAATGAGHLDILYASAWFPWVLWAIHRAVMDAGRARQNGAVLGIIGALCIMADMRLGLFAFAAGGALAIWLSGQLNPARRRSAALAIAFGAALAIGLTAVQWLPLLDLVPYLSRSGMTEADAAVFSLRPARLITLLLPNRGGSQETMIYVGLPVLILAVIGLARSPRRHIVWIVVAVIGGLYALGDQGFLWPVLVRLVPPLLWLRVPSRAWIAVVIALIILAGFGLESLVGRRSHTRLAVGLLAFGAVISLLAVFSSVPVGTLAATAGGSLAMGALLLAQNRLQASTVIVLGCAVIALDLVWMDISLVRGLPQSIWLDSYAPVAQALLDAGVTRLYSPDYSLPQEAAAYWNIPELGGVDPFQLRGYVSAFEAATGVRAAGYSVTLPAYNSPDPRTANRDMPIDAEKLAQWNVSHVLSGFPIDAADLRLTQRVEGLYLYENTRRPQGVAVAWDGPNRFTASNKGDQVVNVEAWAPGWQPTGDQANGVAIALAPGETINRQYDPPGLVPGVALSAASLLITGIIAARTYHRDHRFQA